MDEALIATKLKLLLYGKADPGEAFSVTCPYIVWSGVTGESTLCRVGPRMVYWIPGIAQAIEGEMGAVTIINFHLSLYKGVLPRGHKQTHCLALINLSLMINFWMP